MELRKERKELRRLAPVARLAHRLTLFASIRLASHVERVVKRNNSYITLTEKLR